MAPQDHQTGEQSPVWFRSRWLNAMAVAKVKPGPRLVAYVYADFARDKNRAWVSLEQLMRSTGFSRRAAISNRSSLVKDRWLIEVEKASQHKSARYVLAIPDQFRGADTAPLEEPGVQITQFRGAEIDSQGCRSRTRSISNQAQDHSLSPNERSLMQVLHCNPDDERLKAADPMMTANNVRAPAQWLRTAQRNGDLDALISKYAKPAEPNRVTASVEMVICTGIMDDGRVCAQPIHPNRRDKPCIACGHINKPFLRDVNAS